MWVIRFMYGTTDYTFFLVFPDFLFFSRFISIFLLLMRREQKFNERDFLLGLIGNVERRGDGKGVAMIQA